MISKLKTYWNYGNSYLSIEIISINGKEVFHIVGAKKKKDEFTSFSFFKSDSIEALSKELNSDQHSYLTINTDKVLIKETTFFSDPQKAVSTAFPGVSFSGFYYEIFSTKTKCFVAIIRKEDVNQLLKQFEEQKISILGFQLGFSSVSKLLPSLSQESINTSNYSIVCKENSIESFSKNSDVENVNYTIDNIPVKSNFLIALSGLFNYVATAESKSNFKEENSSVFLKFQEQNFFKKGMLIAIAILLGSLLINFFVFNSYYNKLQSQQETVQVLKSQKESYLSKSKAIESKEQLANNILNSGSSKSSFYFNRLVAYKPSTILFNSVDYQPLQKAVRSNKNILYDKNSILISGQSTHKGEFSSWIETLERLDWITSVSVINYSYSKNNISNFELKLSIKNDEL